MTKTTTYRHRRLDNCFAVEVLPGLLFVGILVLAILSGVLGGCA